MEAGPPRAVIFRNDDVDAFVRASGDANPLHTDPGYARLTPFGRCLVHGIAGVLALVREATGDEPVLARNLAARFSKPLFAGVRYPLHVKRTSDGTLVAVLGDPESPHIQLDLAFARAERPWPPARLEPTRGRAEARDLDPSDVAQLVKVHAGAYAPDLTEDTLPRALPPAQLAALLWSSWLVGMEAPGRQALFRSLSIDFAPGARSLGGPLSYEAQVDSYRPEASLFTLSARLEGEAGPLATAAITAARRPLPLEPAFGALEALAGKSAALEGKRALVTGSSRGLGALLAHGLALQGASVLLHGLENTRAAERVAHEIELLGRESAIVPGDVRRRETWTALRSAAESRGGLDVFVLNAAPLPFAAPLAEATSDPDEDFLAEGVRAAALGLREIVPLVAKRSGAVVAISSDVVSRAPRDRSRETAVKGALEALVRGLAAEHPGVRFLTARPPRLHTDRTNDIFPALRGRPPEGVAAAIVRALLEPRAPGHELLESFDRA
jgi:NAD(P)-dependent dehydrogenase (short-subunit alcohol dehydrogenase family)